MRVLVACEFSGIVRDAFLERGHDAWSCDIIPSESNKGPHLATDVRLWLKGKPKTIGFRDKPGGPIVDKWRYADPNKPWDLMIAHPPCTHLAVSGARWMKEKGSLVDEALDFVRMLMNAPIPKICIENPVSIISSRIRKPDQIIQPWQFGHGETKKTCLWLKNLPPLKPTCVVEGREQRIWKMAPSETRWKERSRTFTGIAKAMAEQWG